MGNTIIQPEDYKYYVATPDPSFSPKRNQHIIDETVRETEQFFAEIGSHIGHELGNRLDIFSHYGTYRFNRGEKTLRGYVGEQRFAELIGEKIMSRVRVADSVNRLNGNSKYKGFIQL